MALKHIMYIVGAALLCGCATGDRLSGLSEITSERLHRSAARIAARRDSADSMNIHLKAAWFEERIRKEFMPAPFHLVARGVHPARPLAAHVEATSHYLAALAFKYGATADADTEALAREVVMSLMELDRSNPPSGQDRDGLDGYIPRTATVSRGRLSVGENSTHANAYSQLLFAYVVSWQQFDDEHLRLLIQKHVSLIVDHYLRHDLVLKDQHGDNVPFSNLNRTLSRSRLLDGLVLLEAGKGIMDVDSSSFPKLIRTHDTWTGDGARAGIGTLHVRVLNVELPSHSTDWLNFVRLYTLTRLSRDRKYPKALKRLYKSQRKERNPFFAVVYYGSRGRFSRRARSRIRRALEAFPLNPDNGEIINSRNPEIRRKRVPPINKFRLVPEARRPLPIYQRPLSSYEWKRNQFRLDGNLDQDGKTRFSGVDYILVYWMARYHFLLD